MECTKRFEGLTEEEIMEQNNFPKGYERIREMVVNNDPESIGGSVDDSEALTFMHWT